MSEYEDARRATALSYASRFDGMPQTKSEYQGEFPFREVAMLVPMVGEFPDLRNHQICWKRLFLDFEKAWNAFHMEQS